MNRLGNNDIPRAEPYYPEAERVIPSNEVEIERLKDEVDGTAQYNPVKCLSVLTGLPGFIFDFFKSVDKTKIKTEGDVLAEQTRVQRDILAMMFVGAVLFCLWVIIYN